MATKSLWVESYRPSTIDGYVFKDSNQQSQIQSWIADQSIPHLLFSGGAGVGKTTLAKILLKELDIEDLDILQINASRERGIDAMRDRITNFCQMIPFGPFKVVLLDEADYLTKDAQASLRGIMEEYSDFARFILTCNYPHKIIPAIHSRCQGFHIEKVDSVEFTARVATILMSENIEFDLDTLDTYVKATYPDLRKCINTVQMNSISGALRVATSGDTGLADYRLTMVELFKAGKIDDARKLLCSQARPEEMEEIFRWLYDNVELFGDDAKQKKAILIIKQGLVDHTLMSDSEINLSATLIRLGNL
jgi:DNA polymerase III delta prime subunit